MGRSDGRPMLLVENLTKKFESKNALNGLSFQVKPGVITGLLGPNGAGKTTTMRILSGFLQPTSGRLQYKNFRIPGDTEKIQSLLGYLPESAALYPDMLVKEYLSYIASIRGVPESQLETKISKMVELCELSSHLNVPISFLSKGFKQRVALAGTLVHDPELIILDEPTSGLDPNQISHIRALIKSLSENRTLILSTHILQEVEDICDEVLIINDGKLVANSTVKNLHRGSSILISLKGTEGSINKFFSKYSGVENLGTDDGFQMFRVTMDNKKSEDIYLDCKNSDLLVRELRMEQKSLESIFEELTRGKS